MEETFLHVCYSTTENCINNDSYGIICVGCNACGRINPERQREDALRMWREKLEDELSFDRWHNDPEIRALQEQNRQANIKYFKRVVHTIREAGAGPGVNCFGVCRIIPLNFLKRPRKTS